MKTARRLKADGRGNV